MAQPWETPMTDDISNHSNITFRPDYRIWYPVQQSNAQNLSQTSHLKHFQPMSVLNNDIAHVALPYNNADCTIALYSVTIVFLGMAEFSQIFIFVNLCKALPALLNLFDVSDLKDMSALHTAPRYLNFSTISISAGPSIAASPTSSSSLHFRFIDFQSLYFFVFRTFLCADPTLVTLTLGIPNWSSCWQKLGSLAHRKLQPNPAP